MRWSSQLRACAWCASASTVGVIADGEGQEGREAAAPGRQEEGGEGEVRARPVVARRGGAEGGAALAARNARGRRHRRRRPPHPQAPPLLVPLAGASGERRRVP